MVDAHWSAVRPGAFSEPTSDVLPAPRVASLQYLESALMYLRPKSRELGATTVSRVLRRRTLTGTATAISREDRLLLGLLRLGYALHHPALLAEPSIDEAAYYVPLAEDAVIPAMACPRNVPGVPGGMKNSCFADATIVALFAATGRFDALLWSHQAPDYFRPNDEEKDVMNMPDEVTAVCKDDAGRLEIAETMRSIVAGMRSGQLDAGMVPLFRNQIAACTGQPELATAENDAKEVMEIIFRLMGWSARYGAVRASFSAYTKVGMKTLARPAHRSVNIPEARAAYALSLYEQGDLQDLITASLSGVPVVQHSSVAIDEWGALEELAKFEGGNIAARLRASVWAIRAETRYQGPDLDVDEDAPAVDVIRAHKAFFTEARRVTGVRPTISEYAAFATDVSFVELDFMAAFPASGVYVIDTSAVRYRIPGEFGTTEIKMPDSRRLTFLVGFPGEQVQVVTQIVSVIIKTGDPRAGHFTAILWDRVGSMYYYNDDSVDDVLVSTTMEASRDFLEAFGVYYVVERVESVESA